MNRNSYSENPAIKYQFGTLHDNEGYVIEALKEKGLNINKISHDPEASYDGLVVDGSQMTAAELGTNETVKSYLQKYKGVLLVNASGEQKKALIKYIGMAYGSHDTRGYFAICIPGSKGREYAIYETPRMLEIKEVDFHDSANDEIDAAALQEVQKKFREEVETTLGPQHLAKAIINQLEENKNRSSSKNSQENIPGGLKYRTWRVPNDTQYWQLKTAWLSGYPGVKWVFPAGSPMQGNQQGSFGHNTFISVYLDNRPSNGGDNYQWFSVDFQGWSEAQKPGPNSTYQDGISVSMPMNGDKYEVLNAKNFKWQGYGWAQMTYGMAFIPTPGATSGIKNYQAIPQTENSSTEYESGSSFDVGFSKDGLDATYGVDNSVTTEQPDWKVDVFTDLSMPMYQWVWKSNNPDYNDNKIEHLNEINLSSFQPNSSAVMITDSVICDTRNFTFQYGVGRITTAGYYYAWPDKEHQRKNVVPSGSPLNIEVSIDFGTVLYPLPSQLNISPSSVLGGSATTGTITIDQIAQTGGVTVNLSSSNSNWATVPATVSIPEGQAAQTFTINTSHVTGNSVATITASLNQVEANANVTVQAVSTQ